MTHPVRFHEGRYGYVLGKVGALSDTRPAPDADACPFCGSHDIHNWASTDHDPEGSQAWSVMCFGCECEGPHCADEAEAIRLWNQRPVSV